MIVARFSNTLVKFKEQFVYLSQYPRGVLRYSIAEDRWEMLPKIDGIDHIGASRACSHGDKIYLISEVYASKPKF